MATRKVETALQEVALAAFNGQSERAARMLRDIPKEHAERVMEGALRQWALVVPFVEPARVEELLSNYGIGITPRASIQPLSEVTVASQSEAEPQSVALETTLTTNN